MSRQDHLDIPSDRDRVTLAVGDETVTLTNLRKVFWAELGITKGRLLQYYLDIAPWLLPHLAERAIVMKRYPNGAEADFFYMKRAPRARPDWVRVCPIPHRRGNIIDFALVGDLPSLLWLINLGCIDLHPWYARCDDPDRPDFLNFDLDPGPGVSFEQVREVALRVKERLQSSGLPTWAKTSGATGLHLYVPIKRGPLQKQVWAVAKALARELEAQHPRLVTAQYRIADRPPGRVLVDYNQNAWGRTLASVYSVRPTPQATVSMPVTWTEIEQEIEVEHFRLENGLRRLQERGDLWQPLLGTERADLTPLIDALLPRRRHTAA